MRSGGRSASGVTAPRSAGKTVTDQNDARVSNSRSTIARRPSPSDSVNASEVAPTATPTSVNRVRPFCRRSDPPTNRTRCPNRMTHPRPKPTDRGKIFSR